MNNIGIGTLLRKIRDHSTIYLVTEETDEYFVALLMGEKGFTGLYRRLFKDMSYDDLEVIG